MNEEGRKGEEEEGEEEGKREGEEGVEEREGTGIQILYNLMILSLCTNGVGGGGEGEGGK